MIDRITTDLQHRVIEAAKAMRKEDGCDMTFEQCLQHQAELNIRSHPNLHWHVGEKNGAWTFDVWWDPGDVPDEPRSNSCGIIASPADARVAKGFA